MRGSTLAGMSVMILSSLDTNHLSASGYAWYQSYLEAADAGNVGAMVGFFSEDCVFQNNDNLPIYGREALQAALTQFWNGFRSLEHEPLRVVGNDHHFAIEMLCHYTRNDGKNVTIPCAVFAERNAEGLLSRASVFHKTSIVFS